MITGGLWSEIAAFCRACVPDLRDVLVFGGIGCASYGINMIEPAFAFIFAGITTMWIGLRAGAKQGT